MSGKQPRHKKVPMIMQLESLECGAACLAMILAYYGKWVPIEQVRKDCGVSRDGSNAKNIIRAARSYGLDADGYRCDSKMLREKDSFPCIVFWNRNHFVVLDGFKGDKAVLNDPARGIVTIPMLEFEESYSGVCLSFEPSEHFVRSGSPKSVIGYAKKQLSDSKNALIFAMLASFAAMVMGLIHPMFTRAFMDQLLTENNSSISHSFFVAFIAFAVVQIVITLLITKMNNRINGKLEAKGSYEYFWKVLRLPMEFFSQRSSGDIYQRQGLNASISNTLVETFAPLIMQAMILVCYAVVMLRYSFVLGIIGIASIILNIAIARYVSAKRVNMTRVQMRNEGKLISSTVSGIEMIETIKASGAEEEFFKKWNEQYSSVNSDKLRFATTNHIFEFVGTVVSVVTNSVITMIGIWFIMGGHFTVGMLMAFQGYLTAFLTPASELIEAGQNIQELRSSMERLEDVLNYPVDRGLDGEIDESKDYSKLKGNIDMIGVEFGYSPLDEPLIKDFNLHLECGKSVAFVGKSGCGKSTISKLISGLYTPQSGEILFDGNPIDSIDHCVMTGSIAVVDQDITIFADTIENNIKMWDASIEDFEMILAARDAKLHDDIMMRPKGYQYVLQEGGRDLSGGQRQRLEIARVLAQDPTIVILDEATSALDAKTEAEVVKSITARGLTCIVIAHRLSTIRDCDEIIVLDKGRIVERGRHEELYAKNGLYTELVVNE